MDRPPTAVVDRALALTRRLRGASGADRERLAQRRDRLLASVGYRCRVREDERGATLVCYPAEWLEDGTVDMDAIEDVSRGIERSLEGPTGPEDWDAIEADNRSVVRAVRDRYGHDHAANATAFADFMSNHYGRTIATATERHHREFLEEYYPRNVWPSNHQQTLVERSLELTIAVAEEMVSGQ